MIVNRFPLLTLVLAAAACGGGGDVSFRAELVRVPSGASPAAAPPVVAAPSAVATIPWSSAISITSLKAPVTEVSIVGSGVSRLVYQCGPLAADCLVELNGPALDALLSTAPVSVPLGTYDQVTVGYCGTSETGWRSQLIGRVTIGGVSYNTNTAANLSTAGVPEPVPLTFNGCGAAFPIVPPLVVSDTAPVSILLRLYFDIRDIGYAALGDPVTQHLHGFGCTPVATPGVTPFVCGAYTTVVAVPGTALPVIERYRINDASTIGLMFDAGTGRFAGGYFRRYLIEDMAWNPGYTPDSFVEDLIDNGDGTYQLRQVGGAVFPAFRRSSHSGTGTNGGSPFPYTAVRLP